MRTTGTVAAVLLFGLLGGAITVSTLAEGMKGGHGPGLDKSWFADQAWDDGAAMVSVFKGRINRYGQWRDAEVRHYVVREYLDAKELTKRGREGGGNIPVIKANTLVSFTTGTYEYRQMCSLFFDRRDGSLVKAVGSSQEGCGASFQRWDRNAEALVYDTYWEGEGSGRRDMAKDGPVYFLDELPFVAGAMADKADVGLMGPSLMSSRVGRRRLENAVVRRDGRRVRVGDREYVYDKGGFLQSWIVPGKEEMRRVSKRKLYYWKFNRNGDEKMLEAK